MFIIYGWLYRIMWYYNICKLLEQLIDRQPSTQFIVDKGCKRGRWRSERLYAICNRFIYFEFSTAELTKIWQKIA